jgi:hypothetical protein
LLADPRKAKEVAALLLLVSFSHRFGVRLELHSAHSVNPAERDQKSYQAIETQAHFHAERLGIETTERQTNAASDVHRLTEDVDGFALQAKLAELPEVDLDRLLSILPILCLGQDFVDSIDAGESLLNRIADDLKLDMRAWWLPDTTFLSLLTREQLLVVAGAIGATDDLKGLNGWTKKRLVDEIGTYFADHGDVANEAHRQAREWRPGLMCFPARKELTEQPA